MRSDVLLLLLRFNFVSLSCSVALLKSWGRDIAFEVPPRQCIVVYTKALESTPTIAVRNLRACQHQRSLIYPPSSKDFIHVCSLIQYVWSGSRSSEMTPVLFLLMRSPGRYGGGDESVVSRCERTHCGVIEHIMARMHSMQYI